MPITALAVNANLGAETTAEEIRAGRDFVSRLAEESGLPVAFEAGGEEALAPLPAVWPQPAHPPLPYPGMDEMA